MELFGFAVSKIVDKFGPEQEPNDYGSLRYVRHPLDPPRWAVSLPHQCDTWVIADGYDEATRAHGLPQADAVAELERFIAEAQQALEALRKGDAYPPP